MITTPNFLGKDFNPILPFSFHKMLILMLRYYPQFSKVMQKDGSLPQSNGIGLKLSVSIYFEFRWVKAKFSLSIPNDSSPVFTTPILYFIFISCLIHEFILSYFGIGLRSQQNRTSRTAKSFFSKLPVCTSRKILSFSWDWVS
jgi:hypothetical protein